MVFREFQLVGKYLPDLLSFCNPYLTVCIERLYASYAVRVGKQA